MLGSQNFREAFRFGKIIEFHEQPPMRRLPDSALIPLGSFTERYPSSLFERYDIISDTRVCDLRHRLPALFLIHFNLAQCE
jgi:hypothetical protein